MSLSFAVRVGVVVGVRTAVGLVVPWPAQTGRAVVGLVVSL